MPPIQRVRIVESSAYVDVQKSGVTATETNVRAVAIEQEPLPLPDILTILRSELRLRKVTLLEIFRRSRRMGDFAINPERFMEEALAILRDCKAETIIDGIRYIKIDGKAYSVQEVFDKDTLIGYLDRDTVPVEHSAYDHVIVDSMGVEKQFAKALDADEDVKLFFKLPSNFKIDTPLGTYNPDWTVLLQVGGAERLYFVLETKETTREMGLRGEEQIRNECGRSHFAALGTATYEVVKDWRQLKTKVSAP